MIGVSKTEHVVYEIILIGVMAAFEVPIGPF